MHFRIVLVWLSAILSAASATPAYVCNSGVFKNLPLLISYPPFLNYCRARYPVQTVTVYRTPAKRSPATTANLVPRAQTTSNAAKQDPRQVAWEQLQKQGGGVVKNACSCVAITPTVTITSRTTTTALATRTDNAACQLVSQNSPTCGGYQFQSFFSGQSVRTNPNAYSGNSMAGYPAYTNLLVGNLQTCEAISQCASLAMSRGDIYFSFDVHYRPSNKVWECLQYVNQGTPSDFRVSDATVGRVYGYNAVA